MYSYLFSCYYAALSQAALSFRKKRYIPSLLAGTVLKQCCPPSAEVSLERHLTGNYFLALTLKK